MVSLKGTQTEKNILIAFAGESQARNRYTFFAAKAKDEGYQAIGKIFEETANQEKEHGKRLFKFLDHGEEILIDGHSCPTAYGDTLTNLKAAAAGEHYENTEMYIDFAKIAKEEGFDEVSSTMLSIAEAERYHERRYIALAKQIETNTVFKSEEPVRWKCRNCGYITPAEGKTAPHKCPSCDHPQAHFEVYIEDF
jgi:rubrerythrin